jgi:hypothetical protein
MAYLYFDATIEAFISDTRIPGIIAYPVSFSWAIAFTGLSLLVPRMIYQIAHDIIPLGE